MNKFLISGLFLALFSGAAFAGDVKTTQDGAKCITISGQIELDYRARSSFFGDLYRWRGPSVSHPYGVATGIPSLAANELRAFDFGDGRNSNSEDFMDPEITLNFDIELVDNVRGFIQLENEQRDRRPVGLPNLLGLTGSDSQGGVDQGFPFLGQGRVTQRGGDDNISLEVEQAYIEWDGLIEGLRMRAGIQDIEYDLRGNGDAFFLDIAESEGIGPEITIPGVIGNFQAIQDLEFAGYSATYTIAEAMGGSIYADFFLGTLVETGNQEQDQKLLGFNFDWKTETEDPEINNTLRFMTTWFNTNSSNWITSHLLGWDWNFLNVGGSGGNLEFFAEWVFQYGEFASAKDLEAIYPQRLFEDHPDGAAPTYRGTSHVGSDILTQPAGASRSNDYVTPYSNDQEQKSYGYYFGAQYTQADSEWKPWVEFIYMYLSGDDGGWAGDPGKIEHANEDFVSFEDNDATLIVEENDYGLDIDTNYWKIQVAVGASLAPLFNNDYDINVKVLYAFFEAIDTPYTVRDNIGNELDVIFTWNYSKDLTFELGSAWLWDSEFFSDLDDYAYLIHQGPLADIKDNASMFFMSATLDF
jgi:hypothetical protein